MGSELDVSVLSNIEGNDEDSVVDLMLKDTKLCLEEQRLLTFKDWPFDAPSKCTAEAVSN